MRSLRDDPFSLQRSGSKKIAKRGKKGWKGRTVYIPRYFRYRVFRRFERNSTNSCLFFFFFFFFSSFSTFVSNKPPGRSTTDASRLLRYEMLVKVSVLLHYLKTFYSFSNSSVTLYIVYERLLYWNMNLLTESSRGVV